MQSEVYSVFGNLRRRSRNVEKRRKTSIFGSILVSAKRVRGCDDCKKVYSTPFGYRNTDFQIAIVEFLRKENSLRKVKSYF